MDATKEIRLVLLKSLFNRMAAVRRPQEPVVSFIREAIDREVERRKAPAPRLSASAPGLGCLEDLRELIEDATGQDETAERYVRRAVVAALRGRLPAPAPAAPPREVRMPTQAERAAALLEQMEARKAARQA